MNTKTRQHHPLIKALDDVIVAAKMAELNETAALLKIARLDLLMRLNGIRANELELLSFALARGPYLEPPARPPRRTPRKRSRAKLN